MRRRHGRDVAIIRATILAAAFVTAQQAGAQASSAPARITGRVIEAATGGGILAELTLEPNRRVRRTDRAGAFAFGSLDRGRYTVRAVALGFAPGSASIDLRDGQQATLTLRLEKAPITLRPVETIARSAAREQFDEVAGPSTVSIGSSDLARLPAVGDRDIVRAASLLPGVAARNDFSAGLNVRGGDADQNLVMLDGIPIYNPFHLGGLFGTFIDPAVRDIDVFTGEFPAQFGGRLSSLLDVRSAADSRPGVHGTSDMSLLSSAVRVSGATDGGG